MIVLSHQKNEEFCHRFSRYGEAKNRLSYKVTSFSHDLHLDLIWWDDSPQGTKELIDTCTNVQHVHMMDRQIGSVADRDIKCHWDRFRLLLIHLSSSLD